MRTRLLILISSLLLSAPAFAHRLNEYLEATMIRLAAEKVYFEFRLTPGVDIAPKLLKSIDINGDGIISAAEQQAYIARFSRDVSVTIDGSATSLQPISSSFPTTEEITKGVGDIIIQCEASIPQNGKTHTLQLQNHHQPSIAAYIVSCLQPRDVNIQVVGQNRSYDQSSYSLNFTIDAAANTSQVSLHRDDNFAVTKSYFFHGINHILTGYDHLLFLAALVLAATSLWQLVKVVTAFTIAHSITLTLAVLNIVHLPEAVVEPFIAASIVFVAMQNIFWPKLATGNIRLAVAFFFGLFHGLGFASGLLDIMHQLPGDTVILAILGFTLGIETGNQLVLLPLYGIMQFIRKRGLNKGPQKYHFTGVHRFASAAIAVAGTYYFCIAVIASF